MINYTMFIRYLCCNKKISFEKEDEYEKELSLRSSNVKNTCLKYKLSIGQYFDLKNAINKCVACNDEELSYFFDDICKKGYCISDETKWFLYINIICLAK
jgi:hypothetical protein